METQSMRNKKRIVIYSVLTLGIMVMIFVLSAQNANESEDLSNSLLLSFVGQVLKEILPPLSDKGMDYDIRNYAHMFEYACLGVSLSLLLREVFVQKRWLAYPLAEVGCFLYACSDEFHQTFVPDRVGTFADVGVDAVGFTAGVSVVVIVQWILWLKKKKRVQ